MHDPLTWSFPIGRFSGITVRVHLLFLFFTISMVARGMAHGYATAALVMQLLLFASVLLHEFGHCFAARQVDGDATEILMWPLGGLATVDVPQTARANLITTLGGPAVNLVLFVASGAALAVYGYMAPLDPLDWNWVTAPLYSWQHAENVAVAGDFVPLLFARLFWINWMLFWFNVLVIGFPLDGGRILQCVLWPYVGYRRATRVAIFSGWIIALIMTIIVVVMFDGPQNGSQLLMLFFLALFIYHACKQQFIVLETGGMSEDNPFGYDFSQGYTSLEKEQAAPKRSKPNFFQRWLQRRAERRRLRDETQKREEGQRVDELLAKVQEHGMQALTDEERRFLNRVSAKYRNRNSP
jgi:Zn-dependent protease